MRGLAIAGVLLATCAIANAQENTDRTESTSSESKSWFTRLWSTGDKPPPQKTTSASKKSEPSVVESSANRRTREEVILNRRNAVILKLREIAQRTGDDALLRKADELQDRAWELYLQKTSGVRGTIQEARQ